MPDCLHDTCSRAAKTVTPCGNVGVAAMIHDKGLIRSGLGEIDRQRQLPRQKAQIKGQPLGTDLSNPGLHEATWPMIPCWPKRPAIRWASLL